MRKKKSHRAIYGLLGTVVAVTAIGNVAAKETKPYKAPELRLVKGTEDYDLTEGITYDKGKYTVEYSLTPLDEEDERYSGADNASKNEDPELDSAFQVGPEADKEETSSDSQAGSTKAAGEESEASDGSAAKAESTEASHYNKEDKKEASAAADLEAGKIGIAKAEKKGGFFTRLFARLSGFVHAAELDETRAYALETDDSAKDKAETGKADREEAGKAETKESETGKAETSASETKESEAGKAETKESEAGEAETSAEETKESESATPSNAEGTLDEDDGIIYFDRIVRVVASDTGSNIEFDEPRLEIPSSAELFGIQIHGEFPIATDSNAAPTEEAAKASNSNASKPSSDKEADETLDEGFWVNENEADTENEASSGDSDGATENGSEYTLVLEKPELLLEDAYFTDPDGKKQKKVEIKVKDAEELKDAVLVEENEKGVPVITGMELGTYTIELSAVDPDTEEEITCEREVEVVPGQRVKFDAPTLYIGTRNTSYNLTSGMVARDENGTEVTELYVVDETELLAAKEEVATASNANAETAAGQEEGEETQEEGAAGNGLKKGIYHAVIGAKHPVTGEEFTVSRKVEVIDGYYIYAPVLEIRAGSTDYDLTSGAEVRDVSGTEEKAVDGAAITVEYISDLYRGVDADNAGSKAEDDSETEDDSNSEKISAADITQQYGFSTYALNLTGEKPVAAESAGMKNADGTEAADEAEDTETAAEAKNTEAAKTEKPALQEGTYMVTLSAVDPNTGEKIYVTRQVRVAASSATLFQYQALNTSVKGNTSSVSALPGKVTSWVDFLPAAERGETLQNGGKADVTLTATENTNEADLLFSNFETMQGLDSNASISIDGNNNVFAKDKLKQPVTYTDAARKFDITIPAMQVEMKNFVFDGLTSYPYYGTAADIENLSSKIRMSEGSYLRLDNNGLKLSSEFDQWSETDRAKHNGSRYGEGVVNDYNRVSTTHMMILPVTGAEQKYDLSVVQGSTYSPRYLIKSPKNIIVDATQGVQSSPLAATNIGENATVKLGTAGIAELYYLRGAKKTTIEGTGTVKFRTYYDALDRATDYQDGIKTNVLEIQDDVTLAKGVFYGYETGRPIIEITGADGKLNVAGGKKITVARVANPTGPNKHDGGLVSVVDGDVIAKADNTNVLKIRDFKLYGQDYEDPKKNYLYLTYADRDTSGESGYVFKPRLGGTLKVVSMVGGPIAVYSGPDFEGKPLSGYPSDQSGFVESSTTPEGYFASYEKALEYLKDKTGPYRIENRIEYVFTEQDAVALKNFDNTNVSLRFKGGRRLDYQDTIFQGKYYSTGYGGPQVQLDVQYFVYRMFLECDDIELPKNVNCVFENCLFELKQGKKKINIIGNGGITAFDHKMCFLDDQNQEVYPDVYGGSKDGDKRDLNSAEILFTSRSYGDYTYSLSQPYFGPYLASKFRFKNLYNFDKVRYSTRSLPKEIINKNGHGSLEDYPAYMRVEIDGDVIADTTGKKPEEGGYAGNIVLPTAQGERDRLQLLSDSSIFKVGSISFEGGKLIAPRRAEYEENGETISRQDIRNKYLLTLTAEKPYTFTDIGRVWDKKNDNSVRYENSEIIFYMPNVPDDLTKQNIVEARNKQQLFERRGFVPVTDKWTDDQAKTTRNYTIRYMRDGILLENHTTGYFNNFASLQSVLAKMEEQETEKPGCEYTISWYSESGSGGNITVQDAAKMKQAMTSLATAKKITWTCMYYATGQEQDAGYVSTDEDLNLFGISNVVKRLRFSGSASSALYANGIPLTFESEGGSRIDVFGGKKEEDVAKTDIVVDSDSSFYGTIYGASAVKDSNAEVNITVKSSDDLSIYGGNKDGSHKGKVNITLDKAENKNLNLTLLDGASNNETKKPDGKSVKIVSKGGADGEVNIKKLYNYDELSVESGSLTVPAAYSWEAHENAVDATKFGYQGKTVINDEAALKLLNNDGIRKLGSLVRQDNANQTKDASLILGKAAADDASHTASSKDNPYLLELTAGDPFEVTSDNVQNGKKIKMSYSDNNDEAAGDILFNLSGANAVSGGTASNRADSDNPAIVTFFRNLFKGRAAGKTWFVTTKAIEWGNAQSKLSPVANEADKTITLAGNNVWLVNETSGEKKGYTDVAGAIVAIADAEVQNSGQRYTIGIYTKDYTFTETDRLAAAYVVGKETGSFDYHEQEHDNMTSAMTAEQITWSGNYREDGTTTTNVNDYVVVTPKGNFDFFGKATVLTNIKFNYDKNAATGRDLYANGSTITIGKEFRYKAGSAYANLYGGSKTTQANGGTTKADPAGTKIIKLEPRNVGDDAFYFHDIKDFTNLYVGNSEQTGGVRVKLEVTGKMDSDPGVEPKTGTVSLKNAHLYLCGTESSAFKNLEADEHADNRLTIPKSGPVTYPLKLTGETKLTGSEKPLTMLFTANAGNGDVFMEYVNKDNANPAQFKTEYSGYEIRKEDNKLVLRNDVAWHVSTQNDKTGGEIREIGSNPSTTSIYNRMIVGSPAYNLEGYNPMFDQRTQEYRQPGLLAAKDYMQHGWHITQYFHPVESTGNTQTSKNGEAFEVYRWETAKVFLAAYAGAQSYFEYGSVKDGLTINEFYGYDTYKDRYYYKSSDIYTEPDWSKFGRSTKASGLYDRDKDEWLDDSNADVTLKRVKNGIYEYATMTTEMTTALNELNGDSSSSIVLDFGEHPTAQAREAYDAKVKLQRTAVSGMIHDKIPNMQFEIKNAVFSNNIWLNRFIHYMDMPDDAVFRLDSNYNEFPAGLGDYAAGNGVSSPWGYAITPTTYGDNNAVVQIKMSDTSDNNPPYIVCGASRVHVKLSQLQHYFTLRLYDISKAVTVDTSNTAFKVGSLTRWNNTQPVLKLSGTGSIWLSRNLGGHGYNGDLKMGSIELHGTVGIAPVQYTGELMSLNAADPIVSNGYKIRGEAVATNRTDGYTGYVDNQYMKVGTLPEDYIYLKTDGTTKAYLDATDFKLTMPEEGTDGLYFVAEDKGNYTQIAVRKFYQEDGTTVLDKPIKLTDGTATSYWKTYKDVFNEIANNGSSEKDYTITNLIDRDFDPSNADGTLNAETQTALLSITEEHAKSLIFESGVRKTNYGKNGSSYTVRLRNQKLTLPKNVDVTFKNIVFKYDQGLKNREIDNGGTDVPYGNVVIIGNGGQLSFENATFLSHNDADMAPIVYGGTETSKTRSGLFTRAAKPAVVNITGSMKFTSLFNFDQLNLNESTGAKKTSVTVLDTLDAQNDGKTAQDQGYAGVTQIAKNAELILPNDAGTKRIGSLKGLSDVTDGNMDTGYIKVVRPTILNGGFVPKDNQAVLKLTSEDPLASTADVNKIEVSYTDGSADPISGDVVMNLLNAADAAKVHCRYLTGGFKDVDPYGEPIAMSPNPDEKTIILRGSMVALSSDDGATFVKYAKIANALEALKTDAQANANGAGKKYVITIFSDGYTVDTTDYKKMTELKDLNLEPESITWTSSIAEITNDVGIKEWKKKDAPVNVTLSADMSFFGKETILQDIILNAAETHSLFANGKKLTIAATAEGTELIDVYGGADGADLTGNTSLEIQGRNFGRIFGGSRNGNVTGNTTVNVNGGLVKSVYGGGNKATSTDGSAGSNAVSGDATITITITLPGTTTKAAAAFQFGDVSGDGVDENGKLADSVAGTKTITITPQTTQNGKNGLGEYQVSFENLTGFKKLELGNNDQNEPYDYGKQVFTVSGRFDSKTVAPTADANDRTDEVTLNRAVLAVTGESGHIGTLHAKGITGLRVKKNTDGTTNPLFVDGEVTFTKSMDQTNTEIIDKMLLAFHDDQKAAGGDVVITHTDKTKAATIDDADHYYSDATGSNLMVTKEENGTQANIQFKLPPAHQMKVRVAYDAADLSNTSKAEDASSAYTKGVNKHIIVDYNPENAHRVKGGYVVRIPKNKIGTAEETLYTEMHMTAAAAYQGAYDTATGTLPVATANGQIQNANGDAIAIYPMEVSSHGTGVVGGRGATLITKFTVPIDTENYFYISQVMCVGDGGEQANNPDLTAGEVNALLVDVTGAKLDKNVAKDITVNYDTAAQKYTVTGNFVDPLDMKDSQGNDETLPLAPRSRGGRLTYARAGLTEYAWAFGDANGNAEADAAAVAHENADPKQAAISLQTQAAAQKFLGATGVNPDGTPYVSVSIPLAKDVVDQQKAAGNTYFYLYFKDGANNTSRYAVPISEHTIDVTVPTRVSMVAVKKPTSTGIVTDSKLLAPTCYVVNNGSNTVKVQIEGFAKSADNKNTTLELVDQDYNVHDGYTGNKLGLFLKATGALKADGKPLASNAADTHKDTMFNERNVLTINKDGNGNYAYLGDLKPKTDEGRTLDFTFTARYNPRDIDETNDWMTNVMSYRFSVVPKDTTNGNQNGNTTQP